MQPSGGQGRAKWLRHRPPPVDPCALSGRMNHGTDRRVLRLQQPFAFKMEDHLNTSYTKRIFCHDRNLSHLQILDSKALGHSQHRGTADDAQCQRQADGQIGRTPVGVAFCRTVGTAPNARRQRDGQRACVAVSRAAPRPRLRPGSWTENPTLKSDPLAHETRSSPGDTVAA